MTRTKLSPLEIARLCHEANRAICESQGDTSQVPWERAPHDIQESAFRGVEFALANPSATPRSMHDEWCLHKREAGWTYGPVKDPMSKTHPCLIPYFRLPERQRTKDHVFLALVRALT